MVATRSAWTPAWLIVLALSVGAIASPAWTQSNPIGRMLGRGEGDQRRVEAPAVARYVSETGQSFVFDRSSPRQPMLRFEGSSEVWVLAPQYAPRGDILYKNDLGRTMLRVTRVGGLTLFTTERPGGAAAATVGASPPLGLARLGPSQLFRVMTVASTRASHAAQKLITVEADATPESSALIGDAALVAAEAMMRLSRRADGRALLSRISKIVIEQGARPGVMMDRAGAIHITVVPSMLLLGRPSSDRICFAAGAR